MRMLQAKPHTYIVINITPHAQIYTLDLYINDPANTEIYTLRQHDALPKRERETERQRDRETERDRVRENRASGSPTQ